MCQELATNAQPIFKEGRSMKIEKPDWYQHIDITKKQTLCDCNGGPYKYMHAVNFSKLSEWFETHVEPVNRMLAGAVEVSGFGEAPNWIWKQDIENLSYVGKPTYRALLINIEPIKKWKCPCGAEVMDADTEDCRTPLCPACSDDIIKELWERI